MIRPEILAPAGTPEAFEAALAAGADAVYLGAEHFNARRNAKNFTRADFPELVRRCHVRGAKLYLTLNTIMLESETRALLSLAKAACEAGVDAAIVQDIGVASLLRRLAPKWTLHASTQMAVHNVAGAKILEEMGFSRLVLARECSANELEDICRETSLEIEVFVHGALCMCVSGQCYMSSVLGGRSGNRGLCAQPCRLPFASQSTDHALSLRDLTLIPSINKLTAMGVNSLKIEGRMKRPEYVAAAVKACRDALNGEFPDMDSLQSVFSRNGFTDGYFIGKRDLSMFGIREKEDVQAAKGVLGKLATIYTDTKRHIRPVGLSMMFSMTETEVTLTAHDKQGHSAVAHGNAPEQAINKPTDEGRVRAALEKMGGTPFYLEALVCDIALGLIYPASALNELRRTVLTQIEEQRTQIKSVAFEEIDVLSVRRTTPVHKDRIPLRIDAIHSAQITPNMAKEAEMVILPAEHLLTLESDSMIWQYKEKICALLPRMLWDQAKGIEQAARLRDLDIQHVLAGNLGTLSIARDAGFTIHASPFLNVINSYAAKEVARLGAKDITLSFESALACAELDSPIPLGATAYGHLPLMTVRNCPIRASVGCSRCKSGENALRDRKGNLLSMRCGRGSVEIENPVPLYLADRLHELIRFDFLTLRFAREGAREASRIFDQYCNGGTPPSDFTRGLLYKGLQ